MYSLVQGIFKKQFSPPIKYASATCIESKPSSQFIFATKNYLLAGNFEIVFLVFFLIFQSHLELLIDKIVRRQDGKCWWRSKLILFALVAQSSSIVQLFGVNFIALDKILSICPTFPISVLFLGNHQQS
jgi:hypothetical protein